MMPKLPATFVFYTRSALAELNSGLIFTSIWVLYYSVMKLSLLEISVISIVITLSNLLLEIPTGILADLYSRRLSVIIGGACIGLSYFVMGWQPLFWVALLCAFIEAIGDTCISGALQAWITDETGPDDVGRVLLRGEQTSIPAHWVGVLLSIGLAAWFNIQASIVVGGLLWFVLTGFLILFMPETNYQPLRTAPGWQAQFAATFATFGQGLRLVRSSRVLFLLFLAQAFGMAFFSSFYKFSRGYILQGFSLPVISLPLLGVLKENAWFGLLEMLQGLLSLAGMEVLRRPKNIHQPANLARVLLGFNLLMLLGLLGFLFSGNLPLALAAWLMVTVSQQSSGPLFAAWLNQHIPSNIRSTVLSMNSQAGTLGSMGSSAALGVAGDRWGIRAALGLSAFLLAPVLWAYHQNPDDLTKN